MLSQKYQPRGFPSGSVVKNQPARAGGMGSIPDSGKSHMSWSNEAHASQLLSTCSTAQEPQLLSPRATSFEAQRLGPMPRRRSRCNEKPEHQRWKAAPTHATRAKPVQPQRLRAAKNRLTSKISKRGSVGSADLLLGLTHWFCLMQTFRAHAPSAFTILQPLASSGPPPVMRGY